MSKVTILSPEVISKIAAGEVVERPASVVKELLENSLDAGADRVAIVLEEAGKKLIRVEDNGCGIDPGDLDRLFHRHATSKIQTADDLFDIHSLGFRGEALYSIAAVGDVTLQTKTADSDSGWLVHTRGSERLAKKPCNFAGTGTIMSVQELFFNTPARKKFLKADTAELNQILHIFIPYAISRPGCRMKLDHNGRTLYDLAPADNLPARLAEVLNIERKNLLHNHHYFGDTKTDIELILGDINLARPRRDMQYIFVNGRPVQNKAITFHVNQVYRLLLPGEVAPVFAILINLPPEDVDTNIHPTKREVKIKNESALGGLLKSFCEQVLMTGSKAKSVIFESPAAAPTPDSPRLYETIDGKPTDAPEVREDTAVYRATTPTTEYSYPRTRDAAQEQAEFFTALSEKTAAASSGNLHETLQAGHYLGAFQNKYLIFASGESLLFVDQHAAQERILFEQLITQMHKGQIEVQQLLTPILVKLSQPEILLWEDAQKILEELGFSTTLFDNETVGVHSCPVLLKNADQVVRELLAGGTLARVDHETLARRACRASVMTGERLTPEQTVYQRGQLLACLNPFTCPHGRPTVVELTITELDKYFLR
ncbi:MAG: DNA mismatch repair endonuclease MutL [Candidatus Omnitrophica bacterium]|nr:DNA mismatch repair endonuclease MutL [Candidatus Omnitrophota bacterium]